MRRYRTWRAVWGRWSQRL